MTMIDTSTYRFRVGVYNGNISARRIKRLKSGKRSTSTGSILDQYDGYISSSTII